jgi:hypothetical protein
VVKAKGQIDPTSENGAAVTVECTIQGESFGVIDRQRVRTSTGTNGTATSALLGTFTTATPEMVSLVCQNQSTGTGTIENAWLVGVDVDTLISTAPTAALVNTAAR